MLFAIKEALQIFRASVKTEFDFVIMIFMRQQRA